MTGCGQSATGSGLLLASLSIGTTTFTAGGKAQALRSWTGMHSITCNILHTIKVVKSCRTKHCAIYREYLLQSNQFSPHLWDAIISFTFIISVLFEGIPRPRNIVIKPHFACFWEKSNSKVWSNNRRRYKLLFHIYCILYIKCNILKDCVHCHVPTDVL